MPSALIVAHGQPGDPGPQQAAVQDLAARVAKLTPQGQVAGATLAMPNALDRALDATDDDPVVYPMFMANGWFTRSELPRRLALAGAADAQILDPFGSDPGLVDLCRNLLAKAAAAQAWVLDDTHILLAAHGSGRSRAPAQAAEKMARDLAPLTVTCGFIEEAPFITDAARDLPARAICLPLFATQAEHVTDDLPRALTMAGFQGLTLPPVGMARAVPAMIAESIKAALAKRP